MLFKDTKCPNCEAYHDPTLKECPACHKNNELFSINRLPKRVVFLHPLAQAGLFLIGFAFVGMLIAELIYSIILNNTNLDNATKNIVLLTLTYLTMFAGLISVPLFTRRKLFLSKYTNRIDYIYGIAYAVTVVCVGTIVSAIIALMHDAGTNVNQTAAESIVKNYPLLAFLVLGILGPVCEEMTYRVGLYSFLRRINKYLAFAVTTVIFAFIHFDFMAEDMITELWSLPSYLACGFILTLAYEHRGPACSMLAHIAYNIFACLLIWVK